MNNKEMKSKIIILLLHSQQLMHTLTVQNLDTLIEFCTCIFNVIAKIVKNCTCKSVCVDSYAKGLL